jgi:competence/damage-inducible protein CinA C-terminal domain
MLTPMDVELTQLSIQIGLALKARGLMLASAESCTGGWIAKVITDTPGSSAWFDRGFVTYSNEAKREMLRVKEMTLAHHGAVSAETVSEMAEGALANSHAHLALAVSGVTGPDGGTADKPIGTVWFSWMVRDSVSCVRREHFEGDREIVRRLSVITALQGVLDVIAMPRC